MSVNNINLALNLSCIARSCAKAPCAEDEIAKGGIYVKPLKSDQKQQDTIQKALYQMEKIKFPLKDVWHLKSMGINPPFKDGSQALKFLKSKNAEISYAEFSNQNVHACLDTTKNVPVILINSNYKDLTDEADILALSEAMLHEAGHAKDSDSYNSIQEELDCLSLNVLAHQYFKKQHQDDFRNRTSPLYVEGVNLYNSLFLAKDDAALKLRVAKKYGYLETYSPNHPPSKLASDIKKIALSKEERA